MNFRERVQNMLASWQDSLLWLTILLSLPAVAPFWQPGYHWGAHDARHAAYFLFQFSKVIQDGIWYPRWAPDFAFGYGYPFFNIYGPLSSYLGQFFLTLGLGYTDAVKAVFGLSVVLAALTMYWLGRDLLGRPGGLVAALVYTYFPYHLFDLYVRAALAESVGFIFMPLVIWSYYRVLTRPSLAAVIWGGLAYAALMFTSNLLALLLTPILGLYTVAMLLVQAGWDARRRTWGHRVRLLLHNAVPPGTVLALGLSISAIFFLPAFFERQYVRLDQWIGGRYAFGEDFVAFFQLFSPRWGFGASIPGPDDQAGFQIGLAALVLFALSFLAVPGVKDTSLKRTLWFWQATAVVIAFLTLPQSNLIWTLLPLSSFAQFPWRLLVIMAPAMSLVASSVVLSLKTMPPRQMLASVLPLAMLIVLAGYPYLQAEMRAPKPTEGPVDLAGLFRFQQSADELTGSTAWVEEIPEWSSLADLVIAGGNITTRVVQTEIWADDGTTPLLGVNSFGDISSAHERVWVYAADDQQVVTFFIPYYPGWTATLYTDTAPDRPDLYPYGRIGAAVAQPELRTTSPEGWIQVPVPAGSHFLELRFEDTPIRIIGTWISIISLSLSGLGLIFRARISRWLQMLSRGLRLEVTDA